MSHHPSSADLAAFRASLMAATGAAAAADPDHFLRRYRTGAAPWERRDGIGYRIPTDRYLSSLYGPHARREAAALRSRAYAARWWQAGMNTDAPGHPSGTQAFPLGTSGHVAAWWTERQHGCPTWEPEQTYAPCPVCGGDSDPGGPGCRCYGD